jgi:hypothetical protein
LIIFGKILLNPKSGFWGVTKDDASTQLHWYLPVFPHHSPLWYNLHSYLFVCHWGESRRAYISLTSIRFWRFMPKGEKVLAQSKRTAPPLNFKNKVFLVSYCVQKGEKVVSSKLVKPS